MKMLAAAVLFALSFAANAAALTAACGDVINVAPCTGGAPPPDAPQNCTISINGATSLALPSSGGTFNVATACIGANTAINWSRNGAAVPEAAGLVNWNDSMAANASPTPVTNSYSVVVCNGSSCAPAVSASATVAAGAASGACPGFDHTINVSIDWNKPERAYTGAMAQNDVAVVKFTTGGTASATNSLPRIVGAEWQGGPATRIAVLSDKACDFGPQQYMGAATAGTTVTVPFTVNNPENYGYYPILALNTTYYLNVRNDVNVCPAATGCSMAFDLSPVNTSSMAYHPPAGGNALAIAKAKSKKARELLKKLHQ